MSILKKTELKLFIINLLDKFSDDLEIYIDATKNDMKSLLNAFTTAYKEKIIDIRNQSDILLLVQITEEFSAILFDLPLKYKNNLLDLTTPIDIGILDQLELENKDKPKIIQLSQIIKKFLFIILNSSHKQKEKKTYPDYYYPVFGLISQNGGHLFNETMNIIYLTKQMGGGDVGSVDSSSNQPTVSDFYRRNYSVPYATGGGNATTSGGNATTSGSNASQFYQRNYGTNYATTGGGGDGGSNASQFYQRNYGTNYATTGGGNASQFYQRNYGVNYATTGGGAN